MLGNSLTDKVRYCLDTDSFFVVYSFLLKFWHTHQLFECLTFCKKKKKKEKGWGLESPLYLLLALVSSGTWRESAKSRVCPQKKKEIIQF